MTDATAACKLYSWRTVKTADGKYTAKVTASIVCSEMQPNGRYTIDTVAKCIPGFSSRARAKNRAQKWVRYFRSNA